MPATMRRTSATASKREHNERLTLGNPAVRAAKAAWDSASKHSKRQHSLTFRQLLEYFDKDEIRFTDIAEAAGLTSERVRRIYLRYFDHLFG